MSKQTLRLLMVDDDVDDFVLVRDLLRDALSEATIEIDHAESFAAAEALLAREYDLFLLDYRLGAASGIDLLKEIKYNGISTPVILLTGQGDEETAVEALKAGAVDYLPKARLNEASLRLAVRYAINLHTKEKLLRQSHEALRASEQLFRALVENSSDVVALCDTELRITWISNSAQTVFGRAPEQLLDTTFFDLMHADDVTAARCLLDLLVRDQAQTVHAGFRYLHGDDTWHNLECAISNRLREPAVAAVVVNGRDATQRHRAEQALRESEERYRLLFERNLAGVFRSTVDGHLIDCNAAFARIFGYDAVPEMESFNVQSLYFDLQQRKEFLSVLEQEGQAVSYEMTLRRKDGKPVTVLCNCSLLRDQGGTPVAIQGTLLDITEKRKLYEQLLQAQKMEAIGQLAGGVAHDFNNLLMVIGSYSDLLVEALTDPKLRRRAEQIKSAADRAAGLTQQLLAFSRRQVITPRVLDLNATVREFGKMLPRLLGENIQVELVPAENLRQVKADPVQIGQIIMNLAVNARDAMPKGGRLTIETANAELDAGYTRAHAQMAPGSYVMLAVTDTGHGIEPGVLPRIFEPFFTTKERGKGTGLGLSTVYGIAQQSGGHVFVYSELGKGTTFKIYLPCVAVEQEQRNGTAPPAADPGGCETILLVEDEDALREAAAEFLKSRGYRVLEARTAEHAAVLAAPGEAIDLLLTDVVMPGSSGPELARRLREMRPQLKLIYMSGYTEQTVLQHGVDTQHFLQKPFSFATLGRAVREVLDEKAAAACA